MRRLGSCVLSGGREGLLSARGNRPQRPRLASSPSAPARADPQDFDRIPSPKGLPLIGTTLSLLLAGGPTRLHEYIDARHKELGPIFKDNVGPVKAVFLSDADEMRNVFAKEGKYPYHIKPESWLVFNEKHNVTRGLFFMDGDEWLRTRRTMNGLLLRGDLAWLETCCAAADDLLLRRIAASAGSELRDLDSELYRWSMDVVVAALVGPETFRERRGELDDLVAELAAKVFLIFETTVGMQLLPARLAERCRSRRWRRFERSVLEGLAAARGVVERVTTRLGSTDGLIDAMVRSGVDRGRIDEISIDLMLGAGDTTANAMAWALHLLAKNGSAQEELRGKLDDGSAVKNVVRETLRLYPPAAFLTRFLPEASTVCGYAIPPQTLIVMSIYTSGRDPRYFERPEEFRPDRWRRDISSNSSDPRRISASLPFGIGARSCIGRKIAETQLRDTLAKIIKGYRVTSLNDGDVEAVSKMVTKPSEPIRLIFSKR